MKIFLLSLWLACGAWAKPQATQEIEFESTKKILGQSVRDLPPLSCSAKEMKNVPEALDWNQTALCSNFKELYQEAKRKREQVYEKEMLENPGPIPGLETLDSCATERQLKFYGSARKAISDVDAKMKKEDKILREACHASRAEHAEVENYVRKDCKHNADLLGRLVNIKKKIDDYEKAWNKEQKEVAREVAEKISSLDQVVAAAKACDKGLKSLR